MRHILRHAGPVMAALLVMAMGASAFAQAGQKYAILVGVQKYSKSSGLSDLAYTEKDVEALAGVLVDSGYRESDVALLTQKKALTENDLKYLPTRKNILDEIGGRLKLLDKDDSILIAFAGHGLQFKMQKDCYFCPADAVVDDKETLVSLKDVYSDLEKCPATVKLVICDACRNSPLAAGVRRAIVDLESVSRPQEIEPPGGVAALYSCSQGETAFENGELGHGVFFHYVIQGLQGKADFDKDQQVDLLELAKYTQKQVKDYVFTKYDRATQVPQLLGTTRGLVPLIDLKPGRGAGDGAMSDSWVVSVDSAPIQMGEKVVYTAARGDRFLIDKEQGEWAWVRIRSNVEPLGWMQKKHLKQESAGAPGNDLLVLWGESWWPAVTLKVEGGKWLIHYYGHDKSWDEWIERDRTTAVDRKLTPFDHVVEWKGKYWPCRVLQTNGNEIQVEYNGFNSLWNEWVGKDRVAPIDAKLSMNRQINADLQAK